MFHEQTTTKMNEHRQKPNFKTPHHTCKKTRWSLQTGSDARGMRRIIPCLYYFFQLVTSKESGLWRKKRNRRWKMQGLCPTQAPFWHRNLTGNQWFQTSVKNSICRCTKINLKKWKTTSFLTISRKMHNCKHAVTYRDVDAKFSNFASRFNVYLKA